MPFLNCNLTNHTSVSQRIRIITEAWAQENIFCPICGNSLSQYPNNTPVGDFFCEKCTEDFELKSKKGIFGTRIVDGAYGTMIDRLNSAQNPNFFGLNYSKEFEVINFFVIPKFYFTPAIIEKRKPLSVTAKRAGWTGCNILLDPIPESGKIFYIKEGKISSKSQVLDGWHKTNFLEKTANLETKGWLLDTMRCIDMLGKDIFALKEMYEFERYLSQMHPGNNHIPDKIRQQLQKLITYGYIERLENGIYQKL